MSVKVQIIYWRDIPAQVKARAGRQRLSRPLSKRFEVAIDEAAMRAGITDSDGYLAEWRNGEWQEQEGNPETILTTLVDELETAYPPERLRTLIKQGGLEQESE
ncbi:virulence factor [Candidatus Leptofilum sp.]|uniref:virulence factor n=1 Tax=Candidatus Leptofilum sp. TaxID=3241576 RepID=UPI003B59E154